jgi:hypothetical protein
MNEDPDDRREREFDAVTFVLAGLLAAIVLGAVAYGIFNSSHVAGTVPSMTGGSQSPAQTAPPATTGSR